MSNALELLEQSPINFTYIPLNHVDPTTGEFICSPASMDCESTKFDSCLVHAINNKSSPLASNQQGLAKFLMCFEGPFANREMPTDSRARRPCFESAFGADGTLFQDILACAANPAVRASYPNMFGVRIRVYSRMSSLNLQLGPGRVQVDPPRGVRGGAKLKWVRGKGLMRNGRRTLAPAGWRVKLG